MHLKTLRQINWNKLGWIAAIEVATVMCIAAFFLPGGDDLHRYYLPFSRNSLDSGFIPFFAQWLLFPLGFLPDRFAWPIWTFISLTGLLCLCKWTKVNPALVLLSFPVFGQTWLGQIDVIICFGLALALLGKNSYIRGFGILLALIKPQVTLVAILILLTQEKKIWKVLIAPLITFFISFLVYGWGWPINWIQNASNNLPPHVWRLASGDIWPFSLLLVWVPFLFKERSQRFEAGTLVSAMSTPFVGVYSYLVFLVFNRDKWWSLPLSFAWVLTYPFIGKESMRFAWILPLGLLASMAIPQVREKFNTKTVK